MSSRIVELDFDHHSAKLYTPLYRAYLLEEPLRMVFHVGDDEAMRSLERAAPAALAQTRVVRGLWTGKRFTLSGNTSVCLCTGLNSPRSSSAADAEISVCH